MTETEWLNGADPTQMLAFLRTRTSDRKARLFFCAGCRTIWHLLIRSESQKAVEVAEQFADGLATTKDLQNAAYWSEADCLGFDYYCLPEAWLAHYVAKDPGDLLPFDPESDQPYNFTRWFMVMRSHMSDLNWPVKQLLSEVFGNPFRTVTLDASWLTSTVLALARQMYESRDFSAMPILADALQDAGCNNDDVLDHCRQPGEHVRGCWCVDALLGKA